MRTVSWLLFALALTGCTATGNKPDATVTRTADGYEVTLYATRGLMVHDPVSLIFHRSYELESRIRVPSIEGRVDAADASVYEVSEFDKAAEKKAPSTHPVDLRLREHYEKERRPRLTGALVFSGHTLTVDVQAVGQSSSSPYPFNGTYRLKTRQ
ncbi:hypothetical protein CKY39_08745 [Variovorax boronicumulans]|uniref:Uncharacterized protein n=1 Tax=Variovorax boronicumulans TaxID=436515 RepID=A0A250DFZ2_9BURK|nr:hypothetical protein [Variovorax boronicumulans]ATA53287.1 hypothetical protein CKY39_08745 [Variovorax boronicumulans]